MEFNCRTVSVTVVVFALSIIPTTCEESVPKPGPLHMLCGTDFIDVWKYICEIKSQKQEREDRMQYSLSSRKKRSVMDFEKSRSYMEVLESKTAHQFLNSLRRSRRAVMNDNANEECCQEKCSYREVGEYAC